MNDKLVFEKTIKYLNKLLKQKPLTSLKEINEVKKLREELNSMIYEKKPIRSKNANSMCWALCTKIGDTLKKPKEEVYLDMLKSYGQSMLLPIESGKNPYGFTKYYEYITTSKLNGKDADWYKFYKGSSNYDKKEMSILLKGILQECYNLEIPTITDEEFNRLIGGWNND